jgi:hypothetical protein
MTRGVRVDGSTVGTTTEAASGARFDAAGALVEAMRGLPEMWRGAGPALVATAVLWTAAQAAPGAFGALSAVLALAVGMAAYGARVRIGVAGLEGAQAAGLGRGGFQWRRLEARLLGAGLLVLLFMTIILSIVALTALALFGAAGLNAQAIAEGDWARVGPGWKLALLAVVTVGLLALPTILAVRVSLYAQATLAWGRMTSLGATGLTNGAMGGLLLGLMACSAPLMVWLALLATTGMAGPWAAGVTALILTLVQAPLSAGFLGRAWRALGRPAG